MSRMTYDEIVDSLSNEEVFTNKEAQLVYLDFLIKVERFIDKEMHRFSVSHFFLFVGHKDVIQYGPDASPKFHGLGIGSGVSFLRMWIVDQQGNMKKEVKGNIDEVVKVFPDFLAKYEELTDV